MKLHIETVESKLEAFERSNEALAHQNVTLLQAQSTMEAEKEAVDKGPKQNLRELDDMRQKVNQTLSEMQGY